MLGVSPPGRLDEADRHAKRLFGSAALEDVVEVVLVAVAVLPRHFALAASGFARALEVEVQAVPLRGVCEDVAHEHLETVPDDLSPAMGE